MMGSRHADSRRRSSATQHDDPDETESLLLSRTRSHEFSVAESVAVQEVASKDDGDEERATAWPQSVRYLLLLCALLASLSFGVTQVPLLYVFRLMTCDAYYKDHASQPLSEAAPSPPTRVMMSIIANVLGPSTYSPNHGVNTDRCSIHPIESSTALSVSLLGASTTVFGTLNLFLTGSLIKRIGVKATLMTQVFFPAIRLVIQSTGVQVWGSTGIIIVQCSQIITIIGGPSGYLLTLNTYITEVVEYEGRTAALGRLTGSMMFGSALGFLLGGFVAEIFGIMAPFLLALIMFLTSCAYVFACLPYIPPAEKKTADLEVTNPKKKTSAIGKFFAPLAVFAPRKFITNEGVVNTEYGAFLLAWGVFLGILATGYLPTLLQLYSTDVFDFGTKQNGALIFMYSMLRGVFLTFAFPKLISVGRQWTLKKEEQRSRKADDPEPAEREPLLGSRQNGTANANHGNSEDTQPKKEQTFAFDLTYTKFSLIADGLLTLLCSFVREGWQMYLVAAVLPFAAGTGSAAKGTILQMVGHSASSSERTDALAGVSLVENIARLSQTFVFGVIFAGFASIGRTELVFTCNAAVALIGFGFLLFARFPPEGSRRLDQKDASAAES